MYSLVIRFNNWQNFPTDSSVLHSSLSASLPSSLSLPSPLSLTPFISLPSSHSLHLTLFISLPSSHSLHLTPFISLSSSQFLHLTHFISLPSSHSLHLSPFISLPSSHSLHLTPFFSLPSSQSLHVHLLSLFYSPLFLSSLSFPPCLHPSIPPLTVKLAKQIVHHSASFWFLIQCYLSTLVLYAGLYTLVYRFDVSQHQLHMMPTINQCLKCSIV